MEKQSKFLIESIVPIFFHRFNANNQRIEKKSIFLDLEITLDFDVLYKYEEFYIPSYKFSEHQRPFRKQ